MTQHEPSSPDKTRSRAESHTPTHGHTCKQETILFVDDEQMLRDLGRAILRRHGYQVLVAENGEEAVELYRRHPGQIDLVVLDLVMPRLGGREAFRELIAIDPRVRVLFASGFVAEPVTELSDPRVRGFVNKPYHPEDLAAQVRAALDQVPQ